MLDLAANGAKGKLATEFFGTKNYDRWYHQRYDCRYGAGPRHGTTVFSIGLHLEVRDTELTPEQVDAALYILENMRLGKLTVTKQGLAIGEGSTAVTGQD